MVHGLLALALGQARAESSERDPVEVGAELRLDVGAVSLQQAPQVHATVSRAAVMLTAAPTDKVTFWLLGSVDQQPGPLLYADDGTRVQFPGGFSPRLIEANAVRAGERVSLGLGRDDSLLGVAWFGQVQQIGVQPLFYLGPLSTLDVELGFTPRSRDMVRGSVAWGPATVMAQGFVHQGRPGAEARLSCSGRFGHLAAAGARLDEQWSWSASWVWFFGGAQGYLVVMGQGERLGFGGHAAWTWRELELGLQAGFDEPSLGEPLDGTFSVAGAGAWTWGPGLRAGPWWRSVIPEDVDFPIEHETGVQLRAWF